MKKTKIPQTLAALLFLTATLSACGAGMTANTSETKEGSRASKAGSVWLPPISAARKDGAVGDRCQLGVQARLSLAGEQLTGVVLTDRTVSGDCDAQVEPNERFYQLEMLPDECGSKHYRGFLGGDKGTSRLTLVDHSQRTCDDYHPYSIEIEESDAATGTTLHFDGRFQ